MGDGFKGAIGKVPQVEVVDLLDSDAEEEGALAPEEAEEEEEEEEEVLPEEAEDEQDALAPEEAEVGEGALALEEALAATLEETLKPDGKLPIPADMPTEALPQSEVRGKKNYTIYAGVVGNDARVEVQLANESFWLRYVHVLNDDESRTPPYRNLSWSKIGSVDKAWEQAKQAVHWDEAVAAQAAAEEVGMEPWLRTLETFAGVQACGYDIDIDDRFMDILSPLGFAHLIALAVALEEKGLNSNAPVCSSWVWVNRNTAGRRVDRPLGDETQRYVRQANCMVERCILLILLLMSKGVFFVLEQPRGSSMRFHPRFQWMLQKHKIWMVSFNMSRPEASLVPLPFLRVS
ncbi:unnamed protein product [Prorocentrum cordatum]|uniref:Uncharacterized protein n=1 Tax=Prorocentrum cordatum TaxID=2364126 RepID=A0ABN9VP45_9DINO|nr:unnamed protein product [Polarella glacialis]